jgi:hypothetical protein
MNRSILIVICDFLLVSLLAFSTADISKTTNEGVPRQVKTTIQAKSKENEQDLTAVMRLALEQEHRGREQALGELARTRQAVTERERQAQVLQQQIDEREQQALALRQDLQQREQQTLQLQQGQTNLLQQFATAQTNIESLDRQLHSASTEALMSQERLAALQAELKKQAEAAAALQQQLGHLAQSNLAVLGEKQRLAGQLQVAEAEKRMATEQVTRMQEEVKVERAEKAKLMEGVKTLATGQANLTQELQENRPLASNTIFNQFVSNRVETAFWAVRSGIFGIESQKRAQTQTVLITDGTNNVAVCHVQETPLSFGHIGIDWEGLSGTLQRGSTSLPIQSLSFYELDPRIVFLPLTAEEVHALGCKVYRASSDPYKFQDAVVVGAQEAYYGDCQFQMDLSTPLYLKMDHNSLKGLFGKFNPSRGDLVFSRTGELLGVMANSTYCVMIKNFNPAATFQFAPDVRNQATGTTLARLYGQIAGLPYKLQ